jgi:hypothetical protein
MQRLVVFVLAMLPVLAVPITNATISGFGAYTVSATAQAYYYPGIGTDPGSIFTSAEATGLTLGPVRNGFIEMTGNGDGSYGNGHGSVGAYTFGCSETCWGMYAVPMPFTLGTPFAIDVSAFAEILGQTEGFGGIDFQFSLFESVTPLQGGQAFPGASVIIYDPPAALSPEPATLAMVGFSLFGLAVWGRRRIN